MKKSSIIMVIILLNVVLIISCFNIIPEKPDLTPPTLLGATIKITPEETKIDLSWKLIKDSSSSFYKGVNIYYYKTNDKEIARDKIIRCWAADKGEIIYNNNNNIENTSIKDCFVRSITNPDIDIPSVSSNYYDNTGDELTNSITEGQMCGDTPANFSDDDYYFMISSWGEWDGEDRYLESPLSDIKPYDKSRG